MDELKNYDSWLTAPYERMYAAAPRDVEDYLDRPVYVAEEDAVGVVESYEEWEDADETGRYGGWDLVVRFPATEYRRSYTINMSAEDVDALPAAKPEGEA